MVVEKKLLKECSSSYYASFIFTTCFSTTCIPDTPLSLYFSASHCYFSAEGFASSLLSLFSRCAKISMNVRGPTMAAVWPTPSAWTPPWVWRLFQINNWPVNKIKQVHAGYHVPETSSCYRFYLQPCDLYILNNADFGSCSCNITWKHMDAQWYVGPVLSVSSGLIQMWPLQDGLCWGPATWLQAGESLWERSTQPLPRQRWVHRPPRGQNWVSGDRNSSKTEQGCVKFHNFCEVSM